MTRSSKPTPDAPVVRLMVLETDEPHPDTKSDQGGFGEILHRHFAKAGEEHHPPLGIETDQIFVVTEEGGRVPKAGEFDGFDGLLVTGSMYDAHGDNPWINGLLELLRELWMTRPGFHFTGVCFGHQLLGRLLGGEVGPAPSDKWELGHSKVGLSPVGQRLFRTKDKEIYLHQMHQDQLTAPPTVEGAGGLLPKDTEVHVWGHSEHTPVQGLYIPDRLFTLQAHLAFDEDMVNRQIEMRIESGGITDREHADDAGEMAHLEHDGEVVAAAILRLFHFDDDGMVENRET